MPADALVYLIPAATAISGTGTTNYTAITLQDGTPNFGLVFRLLVSGLGGTSPTLTVTLQDSRDTGTTYLPRQIVRGNQATTDAINANGEYFIRYNNPRRGDLLRASVVAAGTSPVATIEMQLVSTQP